MIKEEADQFEAISSRPLWFSLRKEQPKQTPREQIKNLTY